MADEKETTQEAIPMRVFITDADSGVGLSLIRRFVRDGIAVMGATRNGTEGAVALRAAGAIPAYPDLTRQGEVKSMIAGARATVVINLAPLALNSTPHAFPAEWEDHSGLLADATESVVNASTELNVSRIITTSFTWAYGDTHGETATEETHLSHDNALFDLAGKAEKIAGASENAVIVRSGFVYGSGATGLRELADGMIKGQSVDNGTSTLAWIHEDDLAAAIYALATKEGDVPAVVNVATLHATGDEFADALASAIGIGEAKKGGGLPFFGAPETMRTALLGNAIAVDTSALAEAIHWTPQYTTLEQGMDRTTLGWRADVAPVESTSTEIVAQ